MDEAQAVEKIRAFLEDKPQWERARAAGERLAKAQDQLNESFEILEDALYGRRAIPVSVPMPDGEALVWDGEYLFVHCGARMNSCARSS